MAAQEVQKFQDVEVERLKAAKEKESAKMALSCEPEEDGVNVIIIKFRTPSTTLTRRFLRTRPVSSLLLYLRSEGYSTERFKIFSAWPRREV